MNDEKKSIREIALGLIGDNSEGIEIQPGLTIVRTILGGVMTKDGRDLDTITPDEMNAIVSRAEIAEDGFFNPENSPIGND